ncbi:MAG: tetratricopeptide repeat protein [candidate division Zixibacteria bacterium]
MKYFVFVLMMGILIVSCAESVPSEQQLYESARNYEAAMDFDNALIVYDTIIEKYPESQNRYKAIFMKGYIYTDLLKDKNRAIEALDLLLAEYPDCDLADDARIMREIAEKGADLMSVFDDSSGTE